MQINEAYKILESSESISDEDLKKKYKSLAKTHHPDISKDQDKFKQINEAYQLIQDYRTNPDKYNQKQGNGFWNNVVDLGEVFFNNDFFKNSSQSPLRAAPINIVIDLTFQECVLGCTKEISYNRNIKCKECDGEGTKYYPNGCKDCDGFGRHTKKNGGMIFQAQCSKCTGKNVREEKCKVCNSTRVVEDRVSANIDIAPGTPNGAVMRIQGNGHFIGRSFFSDTYTDVMVSLRVGKQEGMSIVGRDVCSTIDISLLEALEGTTITTNTVYGPKEIIVSPKSKNNDKINIPDCGIKDSGGSHQVILNINYPDDIANIIEVLRNAVHN